MAAYIKWQRITFRTFLSAFQKRAKILQTTDLPGFWQYERSLKYETNEHEVKQKIGVWIIWKLSFQLLKEEDQGDLFCYLFTLSAFLGWKCISPRVLRPWLHQLRQAAPKSWVAPDEAGTNSNNATTASLFQQRKDALWNSFTYTVPYSLAGLCGTMRRRICSSALCLTLVTSA